MTSALLSDVELEGERVRLVPVTPDFAERAFGFLHGHDEVLRWLVWEGPESVSELQRSFAEWIRPKPGGAGYLLAILDRSDDAFCGTIGLRPGGPDTVDLGYWLATERWGRGLMSEAVQLACLLSIHHLGARVMTASAFVGNVASRRVLERNGFFMTHEAKGAVVKAGVAIDEWFFTLTQQDFERLDAAVPLVERVEFQF